MLNHIKTASAEKTTTFLPVIIIKYNVLEKKTLYNFRGEYFYNKPNMPASHHPTAFIKKKRERKCKDDFLFFLQRYNLLFFLQTIAAL